MRGLWQQVARANNVFPLEHRFGAGRVNPAMMRGPGRKHFDFWGKDVSLPAMSEPLLIGRSFTVQADLMLDRADSSGAILALGSRFGGWSLYLDKGRPSFTFAVSTDPAEITLVRAEKALPRGASKVTLRFASLGLGKGAEVVITSGSEELARARLPSAILMPAGGGETLDVGRDIGVSVIDYTTPHGAIEGDVPHVAVDFD